MKNAIKDVLIHAIVGLAVFMGAFFFFNHQIAFVFNSVNLIFEEQKIRNQCRHQLLEKTHVF